MLGVDADTCSRDRPQHPGHPDLDPEEHEGHHVRGHHGRGVDFDFYVGAPLENDGVGIAPFHNFEGNDADTITAELNGRPS